MFPDLSIYGKQAGSCIGYKVDMGWFGSIRVDTGEFGLIRVESSWFGLIRVDSGWFWLISVHIGQPCWSNMDKECIFSEVCAEEGKLFFSWRGFHDFGDLDCPPFSVETSPRQILKQSRLIFWVTTQESCFVIKVLVVADLFVIIIVGP